MASTWTQRLLSASACLLGLSLELVGYQKGQLALALSASLGDRLRRTSLWQTPGPPDGRRPLAHGRSVRLSSTKAPASFGSASPQFVITPLLQGAVASDPGGDMAIRAEGGGSVQNLSHFVVGFWGQAGQPIISFSLSSFMFM